MMKRKRETMEVNKVKRRHRVHLKRVDAPTVESIDDLISMATSGKYYKNIQVAKLWRILPHLQQLQAMVGMKRLKRSIFRQIVYFVQGLHESSPEGDFLHTLILGPPGTGKTKVAKIIGKIYSKMGILSKGTFTEGKRSHFVGKYVGHTGPQTDKFLLSCLGGVMFYDEFYNMAPQGSGQSTDSFSQTAVTALNKFLSEHKKDFCCIAAGYEEDVRANLFSANKGMERRFPWVHVIDKYTHSELGQIFDIQLAEQGYIRSFDFEELVEIVKENRDNLFKYSGGDIETFVTNCKIFSSVRVFNLPPNDKQKITIGDAKNAVKEMLKARKGDSGGHLPMYM